MLQALSDDSTTRGRLLRGAADVVARVGLDAARVEDILEAAGMSRRTFYLHFRSKEDVLDGLYATYVDALVDRLRDAVIGTDATHQVEAAVDAYLAFQEQGGVVLSLLQAESARPESQLAPRREAALDAFCNFVGEAVFSAIGVRLDPFAPRMLLMGTDALVVHLQRLGTFGDEERARVRRVIKRLWVASFVAAEAAANRASQKGD